LENNTIPKRIELAGANKSAYLSTKFLLKPSAYLGFMAFINSNQIVPSKSNLQADLARIADENLNSYKWKFSKSHPDGKIRLHEPNSSESGQTDVKCQKELQLLHNFLFHCSNSTVPFEKRATPAVCEAVKIKQSVRVSYLVAGKMVHVYIVHNTRTMQIIH
jgi:hypothetical protein